MNAAYSTFRPMKFNLKGKTAVITGGGSGIGKAIAQVLSQQGAYAHLLDLNEPEAEKVAVEINWAKGKAMAHKCNVAQQKEVVQVMRTIAEEGPIHILINNAAIAHIGTIETTTEEELDQLYQVNIKGIYNCCLAAIPHMKKLGGVILNMASVAASLGIAERFAYSLTKGATLSMTYSIAKDCLAYGIRCNSISPARVHTPFVDGYLQKNYPNDQEAMFEKLSKTQPIGRMGTPEEIAHLALYLCSSEASFITGTDFPIDGGFIKLNT